MAIELWITEQHTGADLDEDGDERRGYMLGAPERQVITDTIFDFDGTPEDLPQLKRAVLKYGRREYGRCESKMYVDDRAGNLHHVGYVFTKLRPYEDDRTKKYRHTVWVGFEQKINGCFVTFRLDEPMRYEGC